MIPRKEQQARTQVEGERYRDGRLRDLKSLRMDQSVIILIRLRCKGSSESARSGMLSYLRTQIPTEESFRRPDQQTLRSAALYRLAISTSDDQFRRCQQIREDHSTPESILSSGCIVNCGRHYKTQSNTPRNSSISKSDKYRSGKMQIVDRRSPSCVAAT